MATLLKELFREMQWKRKFNQKREREKKETFLPQSLKLTPISDKRTWTFQLTASCRKYLRLCNLINADFVLVPVHTWRFYGKTTTRVFDKKLHRTVRYGTERYNLLQQHAVVITYIGNHKTYVSVFVVACQNVKHSQNSGASDWIIFSPFIIFFMIARNSFC